MVAPRLAREVVADEGGGWGEGWGGGGGALGDCIQVPTSCVLPTNYPYKYQST